MTEVASRYCPSCGARVKASPEVFQKPQKCPKCDKVVTFHDYTNDPVKVSSSIPENPPQQDWFDTVLYACMVRALIYNMVRQVMLEAASRQKVEVWRISFIDALRWLQTASPGDELSKLVVNPCRPNRLEPRVKKRRPKSYSFMNKPRRQLKKEMGG